jgi:hypothetical protein
MGTVQYSITSADSHRYEIIDGQQRMTTFILLLRVLEFELGTEIRKKYDIKITVENYETNQTNLANVLELGSDDIETVKVTNRGLAEFEKKKSQYYKNLCLIKAKLKIYENDDKKTGENQSEFYEELQKYIFEKIYFVELITKELPLPQVVSIFNTINSTGLDLNSSDLFKLQYYEYLRRKHHEHNDIKENWIKKINSCYEKLEEYKQKQLSEDKNCNIDMSEVLDVFKHILTAKYHMKWEQLSKGNETFFSELFDKNSEEKEDILQFESYEFLVDLIIDLHNSLQNPDEKLKKIAQDECLCEDIIGMTRYSRYWTLPYVAAYFKCRQHDIKKIDNSEDIKECYQWALKNALSVSKYFIVNSVNYDKVINPIQTFMCNEVLPKMANCEDVESLIDEQILRSPYERKNEKALGKERFEEKVEGNIFENGKRCSILCVYSAILDEIKKGTSAGKIKEKLFSWKKKPYDMEHIYAQKNFEKESDDDKKLFNSIGNLVVLESSINRAIKDSPPEKKLCEYKNSIYVSVEKVHRLLSNNGVKWTKDEVKERLEEEKTKIIEALYK